MQVTEAVKMWPNNRILKLFGIELPIIQAPMASCVFSDMVVAVSEVGGLGSLPCALLSFEQMRSELEAVRRQTRRPIQVNFFCHTPPRIDANRERLWRQRLQRYYVELGLDENMPGLSANRAPFDDKICDLVVEFHPEVVSFHFGLPEEKLVRRVRDTGAKLVSSATSVQEARWLEDRGCDAIVAQGTNITQL
jgi:nitronate monooxygenase